MTSPYDVYGIIIRWLWMIFFSPRLFELKIHHSLVIAKLSAKLEILSIFLSLFQCYISVPWGAYSIFFSLSFANVTDRLHEGTAFCVSSWLYTCILGESLCFRNSSWEWRWSVFHTLGTLLSCPAWKRVYPEREGIRQTYSTKILNHLQRWG